MTGLFFAYYLSPCVCAYMYVQVLMCINSWGIHLTSLHLQEHQCLIGKHFLDTRPQELTLMDAVQAAHHRPLLEHLCMRLGAHGATWSIQV